MLRKILFISIILLIIACRGDNSSSSTTLLTVTEIIDGNTIKSDQIEIDILGVKNTPEAQQFLQKNILNRQVSVIRDAGRRPIDNGIPLYLNTSDGVAINGLMLRLGITSLDRRGVTDSLSIFQRYAGSSSSAPITARESDKSKISSEDLPPASRQKRSFKEVVREREKGVFLVINLDSNERQRGIGTGFFINEKGIAVSNHHVFAGGESWLIKLSSGEVLPVTKVYYSDKKNDFVIFQVDLGGKNIVPVPLYNDKVEKGEEIFVLGNPDGLESSLTRGVVSAVRTGHFDIDNLIQIDAAISPGSSGSPVMTLDGTAIGIATLKQVDCENCNFAVNIKTVRAVLED